MTQGEIPRYALSKVCQSERSEESVLVRLGLELQTLPFAQDDSDFHLHGWAAGPCTLGMTTLGEFSVEQHPRRRVEAISFRMTRSVARMVVGRRWFCSVAFGLAGLCIAAWLVAKEQGAPYLTVHEWGTFTSIGGKEGRAAEWSPLTGSTDLPGFVEHLSTDDFKLGLRGTIRMETPVMYFYSTQDVTVSVRVAFAKGVITEWYPRVGRIEPSGVLHNASLDQMQGSGTIAWKDIAVSPDLVGDFPHEDQQNRYYAARETASSPIIVKTPAGDEQEKFLFYRGVSAYPLPLSAKLEPDGKLAVKNLGQEEIPTIILFERRGDAAGYRSAGALADETVLDRPELTGRLDSLSTELEGILVAKDLFSDEARAMVTTWQDSWFEEGSCLIYIMPSSFIENVLPVSIDPAPAQIVRVFVGRLEIVTPATIRAVETAVASNDEAILNKYNRFLEPILQMVRENHPESAQENRLGR